jgi:hypothetical protein
MILNQAVKITQGLKSGKEINYSDYRVKRVIDFKMRMINSRLHKPCSDVLKEFETFVYNLDKKVVERRFILADRVINKDDWFKELLRRRSVFPIDESEVKWFNVQNLEFFKEIILDYSDEINYNFSGDEKNVNDPIVWKIKDIFDAEIIDYDGFNYRMMVCHGGWDAINVKIPYFNNYIVDNKECVDTEGFLSDYRPIKTY